MGPFYFNAPDDWAGVHTLASMIDVHNSHAALEKSRSRSRSKEKPKTKPAEIPPLSLRSAADAPQGETSLNMPNRSAVDDGDLVQLRAQRPKLPLKRAQRLDSR